MSDSRPVLVLLPGLMCDYAAWEPTAALLQSQADCRVVAWGRLDNFEAMAAHVLDTVKEPRFALAGHSMGGRIALEVVRQAPERVTRLALLDTGFQAVAEGEAGERERAGRFALREQARTEGMRAMGAVWAKGMVHPDWLGTPLFESILDMIERSGIEQFEAQVRALLGRPDATPVLGQLRCPTLVLCGRDDSWAPPERHVEMRDLIGHAALEIIEHSGHMVTMETPQAVADALARWLQMEAPQ